MSDSPTSGSQWAHATETVVDIVADVRERASGTFAALEARSDVAMAVATLEFGDYSIAGQVSFERKTADDLGRSIISVAAVMAAGLEGLASVDGIGETVAASILRALEPEPVVEPPPIVNRFRD